MDVLVDSYANLWDIAPFMTIIPEAGGQISNLEGKPWQFQDRGFIASNGLLQKTMVNLVNNR
jgi:myo-inositol-1(or 4)-monophosphatase